MSIHYKPELPVIHSLAEPAIQIATTTHCYQSRYIPATSYKLVPASACTLQLRATVWEIIPLPYRTSP